MQTISCKAEDHNQKIECHWQKHLHRVNKQNKLIVVTLKLDKTV